MISDACFEVLVSEWVGNSLFVIYTSGTQKIRNLHLVLMPPVHGRLRCCAAAPKVSFRLARDPSPRSGRASRGGLSLRRGPRGGDESSTWPSVRLTLKTAACPEWLRGKVPAPGAGVFPLAPLQLCNRQSHWPMDCTYSARTDLTCAPPRHSNNNVSTSHREMHPHAPACPCAAVPWVHMYE